MSDPVQFQIGHAKLYPTAIMGRPVILVLDAQQKRKRRGRKARKKN